MQTQVTPIASAVPAAVAQDGSFRTAATTQGKTSHVLSSQWYSRPADQRFLSLADLHAAVKARRDSSKVETVEVKELEVVAKLDDRFDLRIVDRSGRLGDQDGSKPSHHSFGQLCSLVKAPAGYLRDLPGALAAMNLQFGLQSDRRELVKVMVSALAQADDPLAPPVSTFVAATGPDYGRIWDHEVVEAVQRIVDKYPFKVPGQIDWSSSNGTTYRYNPYVDVTKDTTTLYASDRDVVIALVDDTRPICIGTLPNGEQDLIFRGFMVCNSEVGGRALSIRVFYLRGICMNRCFWGIEQMNEVRIIHGKFAPEKFAGEAIPQLVDFASHSDQLVIQGVQAAKAAIVASTDEQAKEWLAKQDLSKPMINKIIETVLREEQAPARSIWDMVQGMTAVARTIDHQDQRLDLERQAGRLLDRVQA